MGVITEASVKKEVELYQESVYFFSGFKKILEQSNLTLYVERNFPINDKKVRPDFHCESDLYVTVLDHKGSLTGIAKGIEKECIGTTKKYTPLISKKKGNIGLVVPDKSAESLKNVIDLLGLDLIVMGFQLSIEEEYLEISSVGPEPECECVRMALNQKHEFEINEFSFQKFIRHPPPPPYTASHLWRLLYQFIHLMNEDQDWYEVPYEKVTDVLKAIFAPWMEGTQVTTGRINKALKLLDYAGWIKFDREHRPITVYPNKSTRSGDILITLIKKWVESNTIVDSQKNKEEDDGTIQSSINDYYIS